MLGAQCGAFFATEATESMEIRGAAALSPNKALQSEGYRRRLSLLIEKSHVAGLPTEWQSSMSPWTSSSKVGIACASKMSSVCVHSAIQLSEPRRSTCLRILRAAWQPLR